MEAAAVQENPAAVVDAALRVCASANPGDPRAEIATARLIAAAKNTAAHRARLPRVKRLVAAHPELRLAQVAAAERGAPELDVLISSREAGLVTDWRVAGPFGRHGMLDFDRQNPPEADGLRKKAYGKRKVEALQFGNGEFSLPRYFGTAGVFYAASDVYVRSEGDWLLYVESPGTLEIFLDGARVVRRDDRAASKSHTIRTAVRVTKGDHRLLVKFVASAAPFRVALLPPSGGRKRKNNIPLLRATPEDEYVIASLPLRRGDLVSAHRAASQFAAKYPSALAHLLLAEVWQRSSEDAPEIESHLRAAVAADPLAHAAAIELAARQFGDDRIEEGLRLLKRVLAHRPASERALSLAAYEMAHLGWNDEAAVFHDRIQALNPSCDVLLNAARFFASTANLRRAAELESRLAACAPGSLVYPRALAARGDHAGAAKAAAEVVKRFPLDRDARELAAREALLAGDIEGAAQHAEKLATMAPNSAEYQELSAMAARGLALPDTPKGIPVFAFAPFRRDGLTVIRETAGQAYSGGPAVFVLNDGALVLQGDRRYAYRHRITRVLNREGVIAFGEVTVPGGAEILRLRTIKVDGKIFEPELNHHKATISMPALAPGDAIELEYVEHAAPDEREQFELASFDAPIILSRYSVVAPPEVAVAAVRHAPAPVISAAADGVLTRTWELREVAQAAREVAMPGSGVLPAVVVEPAPDFLANGRRDVADAMIAAARPGPRVAALARELHGADEASTAQRLYTAVMSRVRASSNVISGESASAEESLERGEGSRAATLLALARAAGLHAELVLAREIDADDALASYAHELAVFRFRDGSQWTADLDSTGLPLGSYAPTLAAKVMRIVSVGPDDSEVADAAFAELGPPLREERSTAEADVRIEPDGTLKASVAIRMSPWRAAQMRSVLRGLTAAERPKFFQELAIRLFPGATHSEGRVEHENDVNEPLVVRVECEAPAWVVFKAGGVDVDQIAPGLGLRHIYGRQPSRRYPLAVNTLLFETADFRVRLPEGVTFAMPVRRSVQTEFGDYGLELKQLDSRTWNMRRSFNIRMQVVSPERYDGFNQFAADIESIERRRMSLVGVPAPASVSRAMPPGANAD